MKTQLLLSTLYCLTGLSQKNNIGHPILPPQIAVTTNTSLKYPGGEVSIAFPFKRVTIEKQKKTLKEKQRSQFVTISGAVYHHPEFHTGTFYSVGYLNHVQYRNKFNLGFKTTIGYSRTFLGGTTYTIDPNGTISHKNRAGYQYFGVDFGSRIGYNLFPHSKIDHVFMQLDVLALWPYNSHFYIRPQLRFGLLFSQNILKKHV